MSVRHLRHLRRYLGEFDYRYTTRKVKDGERVEEAIKRVAGKRLTYRKPRSDDAQSEPNHLNP